MNRKLNKSDLNYRPNNFRCCKFNGNKFSNVKTNEQNTSVKQLKTNSNKDVAITLAHRYRIIKFFSVFSAIANLVVCKQCKQRVLLSESENRGFGFKILGQCQCSGCKIS